jgi:hypothetical protein
VVDRVPATLLAALADLVKWLDAAKMPSMVIGGVAASVLGRPRLTQDVDALAILPEADWANAVSTAASHGILPRIERWRRPKRTREFGLAISNIFDYKYVITN